MLHGAKITDAKPLRASKLFETGEYQSFHLSTVVLDSQLGDSKKVRLVAELENQKEVTLAVLGKDSEMAKVDLYINVTQNIKLMLKGAPKGTEVSLSGYYEPSADDADDDMFMPMGAEDDDEDDEQDGDEDDEDDDDEEVAPVKKSSAKKEGGEQKKDKKASEVEKLNQNLKQA